MNIMKIRNCFRLTILFFIFSPNLLADEFRARIVKTEGDVVIVNEKGEKRSPEKTQYLVNQMDTVVTHKGSKAVIQFDDGAMSVLDEKSSLRVEQTGWLSQLSGKVFYVFRKVFGDNKEQKKVKTKFATIGIRGTTFIVYENNDGKGVALQEGKLNIESPDKAYEIHRQQQADDFQAFKQQMEQDNEAVEEEFKDYKNKVGREFVEFKKSFDLDANRVISFDGNRVDETDLSDQMKDEFADFKAFAGDYVKAYQELENETTE